MSSKRRCNFSLFLIIGIFSCSENDYSKQEYVLEVSDRKEFIIGQGGLTTEGYYIVFLDSAKSKGTIYNEIAHSLDSIFISADSAWSKDGEIMETEGPYGVGTVFTYFSTPKINMFINSQKFFRQNVQTKEVSRKFLQEYGVFGDLKYPSIAISGASREFTGLDKKDNTGYFDYDFENRIKVIGYSVERDSMFILPVALDSSRFYNARFKVRYKGLILGGGEEPQLSVIGDNLVVSYPSFNDILVYNLNSGLQNTYTFESKFFPSQKRRPENYREEVDSGELLWDWQEAWNNQVRFGSISFIKDMNVYVRSVKGEENAALFLELFDSNFKKISELSLSEVNLDLSTTYFNTKYGLFFRAKEQPVEEVMYYYNVNLVRNK
ncbi:hypothetical protein [Algoriphagus sediminis]|uniref:DUF4221 domain-containing protein n=1 Tax=Algoriphagus sediminis TaxID=3057113 RepID=A0ABT7YH09_9BACT|nr:hypothetical protein [Algoriphagus sediminis]MDN3205820.1 hypothetical protein [Algoriphagus sediminis]